LATQFSTPLKTEILAYISRLWGNLTRNCHNPQSLTDEKSRSEPLLYIPRGEKLPPLKGIEVRELPLGGEVEKHGLLYLPRDYVVPGGRFNEMYGWDSHFILLGLLADRRLKLALDIVENLFYEIDHYGKILNANRTYYLGRGNPPFLTANLLAVYQNTLDKEWLLRGLAYALKDYQYWNSLPHLTPSGLSRYYGEGQGPCPEVEPGYYNGIIGYLGLYDQAKPNGKDGGEFSVDQKFFVHDRAERESGWDMTDRFSYRCADFNPVCLNSLLYLGEQNLAEIHRILMGENHPEVKFWEERAKLRKKLLNFYCWNENRGFFSDFDFSRGQISNYASMATFYPLYAGLADAEQARRVAENLPLFEHSGGLAVSDRISGKQWDKPYGWPPLHWIAVKGLQRYDFNSEARRIALKYLAVVEDVFAHEKAVKEKYDVVEYSGLAEVGYGNQDGFGWSNAVYLLLSREFNDEEK